MPASFEAENEILYEDHDALVTPTWLTVGGTSYAIRTVIRLDHRSHEPPTGLARLMFCFAWILILVCLWYLLRDILPAPLAYVLLIASFIVMLFSGRYAITVKPHHQVLITLLYGAPVLVRRSSIEDAQGLLSGLTKAMNWHLGGEILINADRQESEHLAGDLFSGQLLGRPKRVVSKSTADLRASQVIPFLSILHQKRRD